MNLRAVATLLGQLTILVALALTLPILWCLWFDEPRGVAAFGLAALLTGVFSLGLRTFGRGIGAQGLYRREGILIVVVGWFLASVCGALPYVLSGDIPNVVDALFESASGFTTTGASILTDIESLGKGMLFWRCLTQWLGGLGIIVLFVALLSELGPGARFLYKLEVPGPTAEVLSAHVRNSALVLWKVYLALTALLAVILKLCGLSLYDSMTHALSTLSTGGFSPRAASVAAFDSPLVDAVLVVFMVIAGINFSLFLTLRARPNLFKDPEFRLYMCLLGAATLYITWNLWSSDLPGGSYDDPWQALRFASFQVASLMSSTGFATADFDLWPDASKAILLLLMIIGGSAGSTAGGMKVMRVLIAIKAAMREARRVFKPNTIMPITIGGSTVPGWVSSSVAGFVILYFSLLLLGTLLLALGGTDLMTAGTAALACIGNIGPGLAKVGPVESFAFFSSWEKLVLVLLMWLGRLEIMVIAALVSRSFWRR